MINLRSTGLLTKWFVWCCDHLPVTVTREYGEGKPSGGIRRTGSYYVENGTTLCHIFWVILWVPLGLVAGGSLLLCLFVGSHISIYESPSNHMGIAGAFLPEIIMLCIALAGAILVFSIIGAEKVGFWALLWTYLSGLKNRVCPLVTFQDKSL